MKKPDVNFLSLYTPGEVIEGITIRAPKPAPGKYWSDCVHVNAPNVTLRGCIIDATYCEENAIDGNGADNLTVEDCQIIGSQQSALYVKGLSGAEFRRVKLFAPRGHSDGYAGDYSGQHKKKTTGVVFDTCIRDDGKPWRISWANADRPEAVNGGYRFQIALSLVRRLYVAAKYLFPFIP